MGSYGVIKEALLVKKSDTADEYSVVQRLVPATVNAMVELDQNGGFGKGGINVSLCSIYHGGAFTFSEWDKSATIISTVNIPGYGVKQFNGVCTIKNVIGVGKCVLCTPRKTDPNAPYTHLCLVVESPGSVFVE